MYKKTKLFKKYNCHSYSIIPNSGNVDVSVFEKEKPRKETIIKHEDNQVTNWTKYIEAFNKCSLEGTGYTLNPYKRGNGIKGATIKKVKKVKQVDFVKDFKKGLIQYGLDEGFIR